MRPLSSATGSSNRVSASKIVGQIDRFSLSIAKGRCVGNEVLDGIVVFASGEPRIGRLANSRKAMLNACSIIYHNLYYAKYKVGIDALRGAF
jgi:hypothetical protein